MILSTDMDLLHKNKQCGLCMEMNRLDVDWLWYTYGMKKKKKIWPYQYNPHKAQDRQWLEVVTGSPYYTNIESNVCMAKRSHSQLGRQCLIVSEQYWHEKEDTWYPSWHTWQCLPWHRNVRIWALSRKVGVGL
jgi:hypothetical protein